MDNSVSDLYGGELTSDALLVLKEEDPADDHPASSPELGAQPHDAAAAHHKRSCVTMPTHRAVLWPLAEYFQSKFKNWSSTNSKPQITIHLPHGQMHIGRALVTAMYAQLPDDLNQQELLQLLTLADSYKIDKVTTAVAIRLRRIKVDQLKWDTVLAAEQLPTDNPLYETVIAAAKERFMQLLGDLEMVWALENAAQRKLLQATLSTLDDSIRSRVKAAVKVIYGDAMRGMEKEQRDRVVAAAVAAEFAAVAAASSTTPPHELLLQLPFSRLVQFLSSNDVKAASENTVYYTVTRWLQHNEATQEQQQQLAALLRLGRCSPNYLINAVLKPEDSWLLPYCSPAAQLTAIARSVSNSHELAHLLAFNHPDTPWQKARPPSALCTLDLSWDIPVAAIQAAYEQAMQERQDDFTSFEQPDTFRWQGIGFSMTFSMQLITDAARWEEETEGDVKRMHLTLWPTESGLAQFSSSISVWKVASAEGEDDQTEYIQQDIPAGMTDEFHDKKVFLLISRDWHDDPVPPHVVVEHIGSTWPAVEQKLRRRQLVHSDGCLHVTAKVTRVY